MLTTAFTIFALVYAVAGQSCATAPSTSSYNFNRLTDPFTFVNGTAVRTIADWDCRRQQISALIQRDELGVLPPPPSSVTGTLSGNTLTITVTDAGKSISFAPTISYPSSGTAPYPAIIAYGFPSIPVPAGVATITFNNDDIAAQQNTGSRGQGKFYNLYGSGHSAGAMMAWAWGVARIMDALEKTPNIRIDPKRVGVTGCSRNGKGALVAGAFEPRIALTLPQESGSGGTNCWRISDSIKAGGTDTQTASQIITENVWLSTSFNQFAQSSVNKLAFDHHLLIALIAPRGIFAIDQVGINWLGPLASWGCMKTAQQVWKALNKSDAMGVSQSSNHNHCSFPSSQNTQLSAFIGKFLLGQNTNTNVVETSGNFQFNIPGDWVSWSTPTLT